MADTYEILTIFNTIGVSIILFVVVILIIIINYDLFKTIFVYFGKMISIFFKKLFEFFLKLFENNEPHIGKDNCGILPGKDMGNVSRVPSAYLAHVAFFFSFIFTNAYFLYNMDNTNDTPSVEYDNRRYRSAMIMATIITLYLIIVFARYNITECDSPLGVLSTTLIFGALGFGTYKLAEACGARTADILGISNSFVPDSAEQAPLVCGSSS